jgi:tRNA 2-thiouridine synthesizing protein A
VPPDHRTPAADLVIDGGDRRCVTLLIELRQRILRDGFPEAIVHISTTDPAAPLDLPAWCHLTGHRYLGPVPHQPQPTYALRVNAGARNTKQDRPWHAA